MLTDLDPGRYYWNVQAAYCTAPPDEYGDCARASSHGPTSSFDNLDALSEREARLHTREMVEDEGAEGTALTSLACNRITKLRAGCRVRGYWLDISFEGRGEISYSRNLRDNLRYYHYRFRVRVQDDYCRYVLKRRPKRCVNAVRWRG